MQRNADRAIYERRTAVVQEERKIRQGELETDIELEERRKELVEMQAQNSLTLAEDWSVQDYADSLGLQKGISGFIYHTVPVVGYAWYRHFGDFKVMLTAVLDCGGDTDDSPGHTMAAG